MCKKLIYGVSGLLSLRHSAFFLLTTKERKGKRSAQN